MIISLQQPSNEGCGGFLSVSGGGKCSGETRKR